MAELRLYLKMGRWPMGNFTDQTSRVATEDDMKIKWNGRSGGFRCYLCGHRFKVGDVWRWVYAGDHKLVNFLTCARCDGPDVLSRFEFMHIELSLIRDRFWWRRKGEL